MKNSCHNVILFYAVYPDYLTCLHKWPHMRNVVFIIHPHFIWSLFVSCSINVSCAAVAAGCNSVQTLNDRESDLTGLPLSCPKRQTDRRIVEIDGHFSSLPLSFSFPLSISLSDSQSGSAVRYLAFICSDRSASALSCQMCSAESQLSPVQARPHHPKIKKAAMMTNHTLGHTHNLLCAAADTGWSSHKWAF